MSKKLINQAQQQLEQMTPKERMKVMIKFKALQWHFKNGSCHALMNPYVRYS